MTSGAVCAWRPFVSGMTVQAFVKWALERATEEDDQ